MSAVSQLLSLRRTHAYDVVSRTIGGMWFLALAMLVAWGLAHDWSPGATRHSWPYFLSHGCLIVFYLMFWFLLVTRPPAVAISDDLVASATALLGTYFPWVVTFVAEPTQSDVLNLLSTAFLVTGTALAIFTLAHLGRAFSLVPQARKVVRTGPYNWIRHPLYLCEEIAVVGAVLQSLSALTVAILIVHVAIQMRRIVNEENLLRRSLPEYAAYQSSRWRLVPLVW